MKNAPKLVPAWQFNYKRFSFKGLCGYISGGGEHGIELTAGVDGLPVTRAMCMNLEHYYARSCRQGRFVPRLKSSLRSRQLDGHTVGIDFAPFEPWNIRASLTFELLPHGIIQATYDFLFQSAFKGFEALVSNYFHEPHEPYLYIDGVWVLPKLTGREHRFWARGPAEADNIRAVCFPELEPENEAELIIDSSYYGYPVMITPIRNSGYHVINIVEPGHCASLSANRRFHAHDFSLIARDVQKGERIQCRAWLAYRRLHRLDDALDLYRELTA